VHAKRGRSTACSRMSASVSICAARRFRSKRSKRAFVSIKTGARRLPRSRRISWRREDISKGGGGPYDVFDVGAVRGAPSLCVTLGRRGGDRQAKHVVELLELLSAALRGQMQAEGIVAGQKPQLGEAGR